MHKKRAGGEICRKGTIGTILTSYPGTDLRDDHWERCIFEIVEFTKGTSSCGVTIQGMGWQQQLQGGDGQQHIMQQCKKN